ncbi:MAG: hypothetical protein M5R41_12955 [Bacteroidia bacterium]|nr:hypothetical protein [Bacteroidia bacterium]
MRWITAIAICLCAASAVAQNGGTVESRFGIGELNSLSTARQRGMGGSGVALQSEYDVSQANPATWTGINQLRLTTGMTFEHIALSKTSNGVSTGSIKGFQFVLPLEETFRLRLSAGVLPYSRSEYSAIGTQSLGDEKYSVLYNGSGGLSLFRAGIAFAPIDRISIGAAYQYYFGTLEQSWELNFENSGYFSGSQRRSTNHSGSGFTFGLHYRGPEGISIGAAISPKVSLAASRSMVFSYSTFDSTVSGASGSQELPLEFRLGAGWQMNDELLVAAEYSAQDWTDAMVFDQKQSQLGAAYTLGVGFEWQPFLRQVDARILSKTVFRFGVAMTQRYTSLEDDRDREFMFTTGTGFPIFGSSRADLAISYGWRGSDTAPLGSQQVVRVSLGVSVGESWFIRNRE